MTFSFFFTCASDINASSCLLAPPSSRTLASPASSPPLGAPLSQASPPPGRKRFPSRASARATPAGCSACSLAALAAAFAMCLFPGVLNGVAYASRTVSSAAAASRTLSIAACACARAALAHLFAASAEDDAGTDRARLFLGGAECGRGPRAERLGAAPARSPRGSASTARPAPDPSFSARDALVHARDDVLLTLRLSPTRLSRGAFGRLRVGAVRRESGGGGGGRRTCRAPPRRRRRASRRR